MALSEVIYNLLPQALQIGLSIEQFWSYSLADIKLYSDAYVKRRELEQEEKKREMYNTASMIASFIGCVLNGKRIPGYNTVFPEEINNVALIREQLIDFANKRRERNK